MAGEPDSLTHRVLVIDDNAAIHQDYRKILVADEKARNRMVSTFDLDNTVPDWALCFRWDIVLRGREATPLDEEKH